MPPQHALPSSMPPKPFSTPLLIPARPVEPAGSTAPARPTAAMITTLAYERPHGHGGAAGAESMALGHGWSAGHCRGEAAGPMEEIKGGVSSCWGAELKRGDASTCQPGKLVSM